MKKNNFTFDIAVLPPYANKYMAMDNNGTWYSFSHRPSYSQGEWRIEDPPYIENEEEREETGCNQGAGRKPPTTFAAQISSDHSPKDYKGTAKSSLTKVKTKKKTKTMTKITVIGGPSPVEKPKKPIELLKLLSFNEKFIESRHVVPNQWEHVELITKDYKHQGLDLIFCYDQDRNGKDSTTTPTLYLGHWNDGVV